MIGPDRIEVPSDYRNVRGTPVAEGQRFQHDQVREVLCGAVHDVIPVQPLLELVPEFGAGNRYVRSWVRRAGAVSYQQ